jgi:mono/diheme cytochrome c family protein
VRSTAVHPGGIRTELDRHMKPGELDEWVAKIDADLANRGEPPLEFKSVPQGAATSVWAGVVATGDEIGGSYCADCHVVTNVTDREISVLSDGVRPYALDPERAKALWAKSEKMVGERFGRSRAGPIQAQLPRRRSESGGSDEPQNYRLPGLSE